MTKKVSYLDEQKPHIVVTPDVVGERDYGVVELLRGGPVSYVLPVSLIKDWAENVRQPQDDGPIVRKIIKEVIMEEITLEEFIAIQRIPGKQHQNKIVDEYDALIAENAQLKARVEELEDKKCLKHCAERITFAV